VAAERWAALVDDTEWGLSAMGKGESALLRFETPTRSKANATVVVEASADLGTPTWLAVGTNTLTGGSAYFSDPDWANYPARFYRLRSP